MMAVLWLIAYIAIGVFVNAVIGGYDNFNDRPIGMVILFWPILLFILVFLLVILIIPMSFGEKVGRLLKRLTKIQSGGDRK